MRRFSNPGPTTRCCCRVGSTWCALKPQMNTDEHSLNSVTARIIGCAFAVSNTLGAGYLEKVYENALVCELRQNGLTIHQQRPIRVMYRGTIVGEYVADVVVEDRVLVELK